MKLGFVINPCAGLGGAVALKGSDGRSIVEQALLRGARPQAEQRARIALEFITTECTVSDQIQIVTAADSMGEDVLRSLKIAGNVIYQPGDDTDATDTKNIVRLFVKQSVDLIIFAGGDGTARDVLDILSKEYDSKIPVIGIPAGVKIHSAVYATTPSHAGELIKLIISGEPMSLHEAQVMDLDEQAFREGKVISKCYGYLSVPVDDTRMQLIKQGGLNHEEITVQDIAADIIENMESDVYYLIGSGSTTAEIMNQLSLKNTLLGVDIVCNQQLVASDVDEQAILQAISQKSARIVVTIIGGQGHIFGRGNQQLSAKVIRHIVNQPAINHPVINHPKINHQVFDQEQINKSAWRDNIIIVASNEKLQSLQQRPMISDTGDAELDSKLSGLYAVITGYEQKTLYKLN